MKKVMVSIICNTYNHEKYIEDALKGFVMQETSFDYEVLVHDDASTDATADIIRRYEQLYPEIIKPIYQKENQYSQGVKIGKTFQFPRVRGKYIAICEGDDYWTSPYKLQKQVDVLEKHPEIDICVHKASVMKNGIEISLVPITNSEEIFLPEKVIAIGGGGVCTATIMYRSCINDCIPKFREKMGFDYTVQIHGSLKGGMYYIPDNMACYRQGTEESWTHSMEENPQKKIAWSKRVLEMLDVLNEDTQDKYNQTIEKKKIEIQFNILRLENQYKKIKQAPYREIYYSYSLKKRAVMQLSMRFLWFRILKKQLKDALPSLYKLCKKF